MKERKTQQDIMNHLVKVRYVMDFLDDGYHREEYCNLVKISNGLFERLNEVNQEKFRNWINQKMKERIES